MLDVSGLRIYKILLIMTLCIRLRDRWLSCTNLQCLHRICWEKLLSMMIRIVIWISILIIYWWFMKNVLWFLKSSKCGKQDFEYVYSFLRMYYSDFSETTRLLETALINDVFYTMRQIVLISVNQVVECLVYFFYFRYRFQPGNTSRPNTENQ